MRNFLSLALITLLAILPTHGANITKQINLQYSPEEFSFNFDDSLLYIGSSVYDFRLSNDTLAPALPIIGLNLLIREGEELVNYTFVKNDSIIMRNVLLAPNVNESPTNLDATMHVGLVSYSLPFYPIAGGEVAFEGTHEMDGYRILSFSIVPFGYDAINRDLLMHKDVTLNLELASAPSMAPGIGEPDMGFVGRNMREPVRKMVHNSEEMTELYPQTSLTQSNRFKWEYIVVTCDSLRESFQPLINWKTMKGVKAGVLTTEHIDSTYSGNTMQLKIKTALHDYYDGTYGGLKYVLLGGDVDIVPAQMCYVESSNYTDITPCDLFYGCFDVMDWDGNSNGLVAELEDNIDLLPEITVTRIPVANVSQARDCVNRFVNYETSPGLENWTNNMLLGGKKLKYIFAEIGQSDVQFGSDSLLYKNYIEPYWSGDAKRLYDTDSDFDGGPNYDFSAENLSTQLANGYNFVYINTHGSIASWSMENSSFSTSRAMNLVNNVPTIIVTDACLTNGFDSQNCLGESFMRNPYSNIIGYLGSSRYGWFSPSSKHYNYRLGPSSTYSANFFRNLFTNSSKRYGDAYVATKKDLAWKCNNYGSYRWLHLGLNALGDPELPIYTDIPQYFSNVQISKNDNQIRVNANVDSCTICISDFDGVFYEIIKEASSSIISDVPSLCYVTITKPGYVPYIAQVGDAVFVQNKTINDHLNIIANDIYVGRNVTMSEQEGPVHLNGGYTIFKIANSVSIKNDFSVENGAILKIISR